MKWSVQETPEAVAIEAADRICAAADSAIAARGRFRIVLAGGTTPARAYQILAARPQHWLHWHVYLGDERCLPINDAGRNSTMIQHQLLGRVEIPASQVHMIPAELGAERAASIYAETVSTALPFDMVLLGMGEDGHTASLFPGAEYPHDALVVPVFHAPKPPPQRVSLTPPALGSCRQLLYIVTGEAKHDAIERWRKGDSIPVSAIPGSQQREVLIDRHAWEGR